MASFEFVCHQIDTFFCRDKNAIPMSIHAQRINIGGWGVLSRGEKAITGPKEQQN